MNPPHFSKTVAIVGDLLAGFPHGFANTRYIRLLSQGLAEAGWRVRLPIPGWSDQRFSENAVVEGTVRGVEFEHLCGHVHGPFPIWKRQWLKLLSRRRLQARLKAWHTEGALDAIVYDPWTFQHTQSLASFAQRHGVPLVVLLMEWPMAWDDLPEDRRTWFAQRHAEAMTAADGFWAISEYLVERCGEAAARAQARRPSLRLPILLDREAWNEVPRPDPTAQSSGIIYCASLDAYRRDALFVLEAYAHSGIRDHRLMLIGAANAGTRAELDEHARRWGVADRVDVYHQFIPDRTLLEHYARAAALLAPLWDNDRSRARFPSKLADYLFSGRPVVSHPIGEVSRYLVDGESAFLARPGDVESFAQQMRVAVSSANGAAVGRAGRRLAEIEFAFGDQGRRAAAFLEAMVGSNLERNDYANRTGQQLVSALGGRS